MCVNICTGAVQNGIKYYIYTNTLPSLRKSGNCRAHRVLRMNGGRGNHDPPAEDPTPGSHGGRTSSPPTEWQRGHRCEYLKHRMNNEIVHYHSNISNGL